MPGAVIDADLEPLADGDRQVIFYDVRNRGRSDAVLDPGRLGFSREIDDLELVRERLGFETTAVMGWSYLAGVAACWALRCPNRVTRLVLVAPMGPSLEDDPSVPLEASPGGVARLDQLRADGLAERDPQRFCEEWRQVYLPIQVARPDAVERFTSRPCEHANEWPDNAARAVAHVLVDLGRYDWRPDLAGITTPVLLVVGDDDQAGVEAAEAWALGLPDARGVVLRGVSRYPWVEAPERFFTEVRAFLGGST